ncbi:MAG: hypothetical protein M1840_004530 [Geoglossum simile]|nr:MAG: hypothetical protein M1840_004530 [Geoglossum simile]
MEMPRAVFSTNLGQHPPRPLQPPLPSIIVRSNPELDKHVFGTALRQRWPPSCKLINHSFNISDYFDDMDVHVQGAEFLWHVLHHLACENAVRREGIAMFAMDWSRANSARFEALGKDTDMAGFFSAEEAEGFGEEWLSDVFSRLKEMRSEGRGIGALTRNAHRHIQATAGARPRIQHYASTQVKSPPHIQRISCTSPVYTPSMISSGSWSGQQTPMGPGLDGHQLMNPHGSPPLPIYGSAGPVDSHFNQISPTTGIWDMRGQLPPPRLPADLRQNAFGDHLRIHGSVATRRSRAPPHLRLDMGNASIDGFLRQDQAPLTPFTAASFAQNGYIHNTEPSVAFQSAGPMYPVYPMHNPQFQHTDMFLNHSVSGNAGLVNPQLTHPQPTKPNPVVNTRDPSYISGDARLPRQGFTSYDSHQSNATHRKSLVKQEVSRNEQKGQKRIEPGLPHLDISGEGSNNKIHQSQDTHRASQPNWSAHTSQADYQPLLNNFATPESRDNGRTPLIDNTNRSPYTNATQLSEPPNTNYNSSRGLPHRGIENHLSVFVTRYAPSTTREELCDIFSQFGLIANVFMKQEPYYAYIK